RLSAPPRRFALLFLWLAGVIVAMAYVFNLYLVPQPQRYHLEVEMAFCVLVAFFLGGVGGAARLGPSRPPGRLLPQLFCACGSRPGGRLGPCGAAPQATLSFAAVRLRRMVTPAAAGFRFFRSPFLVVA